MPKFEGCAEAREISLTRKAAQTRAVVLMTKNAVGAPAPQTKTEKTEMPELTQADVTKAALEISKKVASMDEVTKAYWLALDETASTAFLEKSAADMAEEAAEDKKTKDAKAKEDEAAKSGETPQVLELRKSNESMRSELDALKARDVEREIEKRADTEFAGFPGGSAKVIPLLKAYAKLPEAERTASEALLKSQAETAKSLTNRLGGRTDAEISKADGAKIRLVSAAKSLAEASKIPFGEAMEKVTEKREHAADVAEVNDAGIDIFAAA